MTEDRRIEPPPHLLKQWMQAAREAGKKGGPYAKTFVMAAIEWALNSQPTPNDRQIRSSEITPPPELVAQWVEYAGLVGINEHQLIHLATQAARWGNHPESPDSSTQPIPVSERLPRPEDCDEEGRCWGFHQYNPEDDDIWESWYLVPTQHLLPSVQWLGFSHWLPANALPQPS